MIQRQKRISSTFGLEKLILLKWSYCPKAFNAISVKILMIFFTELKQIVLKFIWNYKRHEITKTIFRKEKKKIRGTTLLGFRPYSKSIVMKIASH